MVFGKKKKKLFKIWIILALTLPLLDIVSTILFISKLGIEYESNMIGRFLMENLKRLALPIMYLFASFILFLLFFWCKNFTPKINNISCYVFKREKPTKKENEKATILAIKMGMIILTIIYTLVLTINLIVFIT